MSPVFTNVVFNLVFSFPLQVCLVAVGIVGECTWVSQVSKLRRGGLDGAEVCQGEVLLQT